MSEPFISELRLKNFKCYENITLNFKSGVNLLYGVNGTGKTACLEGLVSAVKCILDFSFAVRAKKNDIISDRYIRLHTPLGMRDPEFQTPLQVDAIGIVLDQEVKWSLIREGYSQYRDADKLNQISMEIDAITRNGRKEVLPVIIYFPTNRLFVKKEKLDELDGWKPEVIGRGLGYYHSLGDENILDFIRDWLNRAESTWIKEKRVRPDHIDLGLKGIYSVVLSAFEGEWADIYYNEPYANSALPKGLFFVPSDKTQTTIPESILSDGYRNFIWLLLEIAWRCYVLNPYLGENAAKETNGIVMIDEVDLHMHPRWQQKIIGILAKAFPKIQFVITTHSPIVLGSVKEGQVILLEGQTATVVPAPYGLTPSYILESYMGMYERLPELKPDITRYFELINMGQGKNEEAIQLRAKLGSIMSPNDPLFSEADVLIQYLS